MPEGDDSEARCGFEVGHPQDEPFVSAVVLNWNGRNCIRECLRSLLNQTYQNREIIVVDNSSTDGSAEIVRTEFPSVKLVRNTSNLGFAAGSNIGMKKANGQCVVLFNNDAVADKDWLAKLVQGLLESPENGIASGPIYYYEPSDLIWCAGARFDMVTGMAWHLAQYERKFQPHHAIDYFPFCALLIKREVLEKIGFLDERFFMYAEDPDFCFRAQLAGFKLKLVPDAVTHHMVSMGLKRESMLLYKKLESEGQLIFKIFPWWCLPITVLLRLTVIPLAEVLFLKKPASHLIRTWQALFRVSTRKNKRWGRNSLVRLRVQTLHPRLRECLYVGMKRWKMTQSGN